MLKKAVYRFVRRETYKVSQKNGLANPPFTSYLLRSLRALMRDRPYAR
jgi:hypothetical protein